MHSCGGVKLLTSGKAIYPCDSSGKVCSGVERPILGKRKIQSVCKSLALLKSARVLILMPSNGLRSQSEGCQIITIAFANPRAFTLKWSFIKLAIQTRHKEKWNSSSTINLFLTFKSELLIELTNSYLYYSTEGTGLRAQYIIIRPIDDIQFEKYLAVTPQIYVEKYISA